MPQTIEADAQSYLEKVYEGVLPKGPKQLVALLRENPWVPTSDMQKMEFVAAAASLVLLHGTNASVLGQLESTRVLTGRAETPERLILEAIVYGLDDGQRCRNRLSAWSAAVRHLVDQRIFPSTAVSLAKDKGQGLDAWARARSKAHAKPQQRVKPVAKSSPGWTVTVETGTTRQVFHFDNQKAATKLLSKLDKLQATHPLSAGLP